MKKLLLIFLIIFSTSLHAELKLISQNIDETKYYVYSETIKKIDGYIYFWSLSDYPKNEFGSMSNKYYFQTDCRLGRVKPLSYTFFTESMGLGEISTSNDEPSNWEFVVPGSAFKDMVDYVCKDD